MRTDLIDFISAYCDRWCERCPFTARCSAFAAEAAIALCGDEEAGLEPAPGSPPPHVDQTPLPDVEPEPGCHEPDAVAARVADTTASKLVWAYTMLAHRWLRAERETWGPSADPIVREAIEVISWDHILINTKLHRAFRSRECAVGDDHPLQNDANGSAKVALISIERSEASWRLIAHATGGDLPVMMADHLAQLRTEVGKEFPDARRFHRPGFDDEPVDG